MPKNDLFNFEFIALCTVTFLAICNVSVFYNFHLYLQSLGMYGKEAGFVIGLYSLTAMALYIVASQHIGLKNAFSCMVGGIFLVAGCGVAYLYAHTFWLLAVVRIFHGAGIFLVMAACMVALVAIIPPSKTGSAFSLYSVALLLPYSIMPAVSEMVLPLTDSPPIVYLATAGLMLPAIGLLFFMRHRPGNWAPYSNRGKAESPRRGAERKNLLRKPVICLLLVNSAYFTLFSGLFFLFEGFGVQRGIQNPGYFFTLQMGVMIVIRLFGGQIFDHLSKVALVSIALLITGVGFLLLLLILDAAWILPIAVVFGLGMGLCVPPLNALMYLVTKPQYRGYNANMMMLSIHLGTFLGPFVGAWIVDAGGYDPFLIVAILMTVGTAGFFLMANPAKYISVDHT
jgi:MFS family permease